MKRVGLRLAEDLTLPLELAVEATAVIGKRGRGKTFTAKRIVEEVVRAGVTVLIIDPTDVWYGLTSGADGTAQGGLDLYVIGGKHSDLPVQETAGKVLARAVLDGTSMVLCPKGLPKSARRRLVGECLTELYDQADGTPILVVIDEADEYAPEGARSIGGNRTNDPLMLSIGAVEDIVRRGRAGGLGSLLITQRVAVLAKSVLEQSDTLIALGVTGKNDIDAVSGWIAKHAPDTETGKRITSSLPALPNGEAWVWSPEYGVLDRVKVLPISTFDSSRTPKVGEVRAEPKARKSIDLAALGAEMEKFAEEVKANDPAELKLRIAALERQLAQRPSAAPEPVRVEVPVEVPVPVLTPENMHMVESMWQASLKAASVMTEQATKVHDAVQEALARIEAARQARPSVPAARTVTPTPPRRAKATGTQPEPARPATTPERTSPTSAGSNGQVELSQAERVLLKALAERHPITMTFRELALAARRSAKSSTTETAVGRLRAQGFAEGPNRAIVATEAGLAALGGHVARRPTGRALIEWWKQRLTTAEGDLLQAFVEAYPTQLDLDEVCARTGRSTTSSTTETALGKLRSLGLTRRTPDRADVANDELGEAWARG